MLPAEVIEVKAEGLLSEVFGLVELLLAGRNYLINVVSLDPDGNPIIAFRLLSPLDLLR